MMMDESEIKHEFPNDEDQCCVCLSVGRKLLYLREYIDVFRKLTTDVKFQNLTPLEELQLCWECHALLRRVYIFIAQVNKANELLMVGQNLMYGTQSGLATVILNDSYPHTVYVTDIATEVKTFNDGDDVNVIDEECAQDDEVVIEPIKIEEKLKENTESKKPKNNRWATKRAIQNKKPKFKIISKYTKDSFKKIPIDNKEMQLCRESERESEYYKSKRFKCYQCVSTFENEDLMSKHQEKYHEKLQSFMCDICNSRISNKRHLSRHITNHYNKYVCTVCDFSCYDKSQRQSHYRKQHRKVFQCLKCKLKFGRRKEFFKHYKDWHEKFVCDHCGISFKMRYCIKNHIRKQHSPFECKPCNRRWARYNGLWLHNKTAHAHSARAAYCVECDRHYRDVYRYRWHLANSARHTQHKKHRIPCPGCDKIFSKNIYMKDHYNLVHLKNYKYRCEQCNKNFIRNADLVKHTRRVHEGILPPKNKICYMCGRGFSTNKILTNHLRTHTGEKPFSCSICNARFAQSTALTAHARAIHHTRDKQT